MLQITRHIIALILAFGCVTPSQAGVPQFDDPGQIAPQ